MGIKEYFDAKEKALIKLTTASVEHKIDDKILPIIPQVAALDVLSSFKYHG
jgi:tRNA(Phe) wybutosine-synthesizing methylase Tyw3